VRCQAREDGREGVWSLGNEQEKGRTLVLFSGNEARQIQWDELDGGALSFSARSLRVVITQAPPHISQWVVWTELEALGSLSWKSFLIYG